MTDSRTDSLVKELRYDWGTRVFGTITGHHLEITLDDVLGCVDHHCWPCAKYPYDRRALFLAAISDRDYMISITDSAPHKYGTKHLVECACAGVFNPADIAIPALVTFFDKKGMLDMITRFTSGNGLNAYGFSQHEGDKIALVREQWKVPSRYDSGSGMVTPFLAGKVLPWRIAK